MGIYISIIMPLLFIPSLGPPGARLGPTRGPPREHQMPIWAYAARGTRNKVGLENKVWPKSKVVPGSKIGPPYASVCIRMHLYASVFIYMCLSIIRKHPYASIRVIYAFTCQHSIHIFATRSKSKSNITTANLKLLSAA